MFWECLGTPAEFQAPPTQVQLGHSIGLKPASSYDQLLKEEDLSEGTMFHPVEERDESVPIRPSRRRCNRGSSATEHERPRSFTGLPKIRAPRASNTAKVTATDRHLVFDLMSSPGS
ncbi:unnamed protein product [Pleuronectes platessa]|uniref:Uncharacterized protein n=1 Tax=Pleuronectes platessa TaxID=8262 RepID=A0A9N7YMZ1_PLEPL|nr:unnamed protein product [Pleuronectes platessa]